METLNRAHGPVYLSPWARLFNVITFVLKTSGNGVKTYPSFGLLIT